MQALAQEIDSIQILEPGDVTLKRLAEKTGRKIKMFEKVLKVKVENGELVTVKKFDPVSCRNVTVYAAPS
jgi:hypothetical protein